MTGTPHCQECWTFCISSCLCVNICRRVQVSDHGVVVMEVSSGLSFPAVEHLSHIMHTQALQGKEFFISSSDYFLFAFSHLLTIHLSVSVSSTVSGTRLSSCEHPRLHSDQWAEGPAEAVWTAKSQTNVCRVAGKSLSSPLFWVLTAYLFTCSSLAPLLLSPPYWRFF